MVLLGRGEGGKGLLLSVDPLHRGVGLGGAGAVMGWQVVRVKWYPRVLSRVQTAL